MYKIVCLDTIIEDFSIEKEILSSVSKNIIHSKTLDEEEIISLCHDADAIIVNQAKINAKIISQLKKCKIISRYGIGVDNVNLEAAKNKNIFVTNAPGYCVDEVSDVAVMMTLMLLRKAMNMHQRCLDNNWTLSEFSQDIHTIKGKTIGILGFGAIGQQYAKKIQVFSPEKILVLSKYFPKEREKKTGIILSELDTILTQSDILSIHLPMTPENKYIINSQTLSIMKKNSIIINTGRGHLINEKDLFYALNNNIISGAGLDVFEKEPIPKNSKLKNLTNIVLSPHVSWYSTQSIKTLKTKVSHDVLNVLLGKKPLNIV